MRPSPTEDHAHPWAQDGSHRATAGKAATTSPPFRCSKLSPRAGTLDAARPGVVKAERNVSSVGEAGSRVGATLLDKWHLDALLGIGGTAAVYSATHRNGMRGAVKVLHGIYASDPGVRQRFQREGYLANRVGHPGAVHVLDDDVTPEGDVFLVMELLDGSSLCELVERAGGTLDVATTLRIADGVLDVLAAAHDAGIVHRDIKPENVFITRGGSVKVLDFGIACITSSARDETRTTLSGAPIGTPAFMAPEQALGRWDLVGPQSDLWSVGATMFALLSGQVVFQEETVARILAALLSQPVRSLAAACPTAPPAVVALVDGALRRSFADRWIDARTMQQALRDTYRAIFATPLPPGRIADVSWRQLAASQPDSLRPTVVIPAAGDGGFPPISRVRRVAPIGLAAAALLVAGALMAPAREVKGGATAAQATLAAVPAPDLAPIHVDELNRPGADSPAVSSSSSCVPAPEVAPTAHARMHATPSLRPRSSVNALFDRRH